MKKSNKKRAFYTGAAVGVTFLASLVGAGVYLWQRRGGKKLNFKKAKIQAFNDIKKVGQDMSERVKRMSGME